MALALVLHRSNRARFGTGLLLVMLLTATSPSAAEEIHIATASNFRNAMASLVRTFEQKSPHRVVPIYGSTGKHYAQIVNGAPFDAYFAADVNRPERLERDGIAIAGSRFTYATGALVLWSPQAGYVDPHGYVLESGTFRRLSMANPDLAPYGAAAQEVLEALGRWEALGPKLVLGENIGQAYLFVRSGNAELGFIARSQLAAAPPQDTGSLWQVPETLYHPIEQQAVLLRDSDAANAFMTFVRSAEAAEIIQENGYAAFNSDKP